MVHVVDQSAAKTALCQSIVKKQVTPAGAIQPLLKPEIFTESSLEFAKKWFGEAK
jgi:hypothetical protein